MTVTRGDSDCGMAVSQSPIGKTDSRSVVFSDSRSILHLKRTVIVAENDGNDVRE